MKKLLLISLLLSINAFAEEAATQLGGTLTCPAFGVSKLTVKNCIDENCENILFEEVTYRYGISTYQLPSDREVLAQRVQERLSEPSHAHKTEVFEATNDTPSDSVIGLAIAVPYDIISLPFRFGKNQIANSKNASRRKNELKEFNDNRDTALDLISFMTDKNSVGEVKELGEKECRLFYTIRINAQKLD